MAYTEEMTTSEILLRLASMRNELLQAVNDIEKISNNICYKAEQTAPQKWETPPKFEHKEIITICVSVPMALIEEEPQTEYEKYLEKIKSHDPHKDW